MVIKTDENGKKRLDFTGLDIWGMDIETKDPFLKKKKANKYQGTSWVFGEGRILYTGLYNVRTGERICVKGAGNPVKEILQNPNAVVIGHNFPYDLGWLEDSLGIQGQTKCHILDSIAAEALLDEYGLKDLDTLGKKYIGRGKKKSRLESWCAENGKKGDVREYLDEAPSDMVSEYVVEDAEVSALVLMEQLRRIYKQKLVVPFDIDCRLIKVVTLMKQRGFRVDFEARKRNFKRLADMFDRHNTAFVSKYGKINYNSSKQLQRLCDTHEIPYRVRFTLKGKDGVKYGADKRQALNDVRHYLYGFRIEKKQAVLYVSKERVDAIANVLTDTGFDFIYSASLDKHFLEPAAKLYPMIADLVVLKKMNSTLSKFLGSSFDRFIAPDGHIHGTFNISKSERGGTISGRFSASDPNLQQVQSKGEAEDVKLAELCRETLVPEENCWLLKIDYSQIEYRLLVHYAIGVGAEDAREAFRKNPKTDYHKFVMNLTGLERKYAKNCNFGIMYGMQLKGMMSAFGWDEEKATHVLDVYHEALPYVQTTMEAVANKAKKRGYIRTIGGRKARLKNENLSYTMLNRLNQGGSADIMKTAMVTAFDEGLFSILIPHVTVHDELVCSVPKTRDGLAAVHRLREIMETCIPLAIPILAEPELGRDWYHVDTRYVHETKNGLELVSACVYKDESEAREFLGLGEDAEIVVKTKAGVRVPAIGDVILRDLDDRFAIVSGAYFNEHFEEVA